MTLPRRILVTGAALRTGRAVASHLAKKGAVLLLHANRHVSEAQELCRSLPGNGHTVISGNLADDSDVDNICRHAASCDGVVLNASLYRYNYSGGDPDFDRMLDTVNHRSPLRIIEAFINAPHPYGGSVVAMLDQELASGAGNPYLASRMALWQKMKEFACKYGKDDLRFNAILPGPMLPPPELGNTGMVKTLPTLPLRRSVSLEDVAACVELLLSCRSLTGAALFADCGQSLPERENQL